MSQKSQDKERSEEYDGPKTWLQATTALEEPWDKISEDFTREQAILECVGILRKMRNSGLRNMEEMSYDPFIAWRLEKLGYDLQNLEPTGTMPEWHPKKERPENSRTPLRNRVTSIISSPLNAMRRFFSP